jgi:ribosome-associated heat shock protein Hsp15
MATGVRDDDRTATQRADVWLDVACLFKTRSLAQAACRGGKVELNGQAVRPNRLLRIGDELRITRGGGVRQVVVVRGLASPNPPRSAPSSPTAANRPPRRHSPRAPAPRPNSTPTGPPAPRSPSTSPRRGT